MFASAARSLARACARRGGRPGGSLALAQGAPVAGLAMYTGPARTERLIAGAKREGTVTVYPSLTVDDMKVFGGAFEKKYGIKLQLWRSSSEDILQRAVVEARGGPWGSVC